MIETNVVVTKTPMAWKFTSVKHRASPTMGGVGLSIGTSVKGSEAVAVPSPFFRHHPKQFIVVAESGRAIHNDEDCFRFGFRHGSPTMEDILLVCVLVAKGGVSMAVVEVSKCNTDVDVAIGPKDGNNLAECCRSLTPPAVNDGYNIY